MPTIIDPNNSGARGFLSDMTGMDYGYQYPYGDMRPGSALSNRIVTEVMKRAQSSRRAMEPKFDSWRKLDEILTVFVEPDTKEQAIQAADSRKPITFVVPVAFAVLDAFLAFNTASMADLPYYRYTGVGGQNMVKALLQERLLKVQSIKARHLLGHHTLWRDMYVYGFGAMCPEWFTRYGFKNRAQQLVQTDMYTGEQTTVMGPKRRESVVRFEGHRLVNWDPYNTLPDPNVSIESVERMEFIGNVWRDSRTGLLSSEQAPNSGLINCMYLKHLGEGGATSTLLDKTRQDSATDNNEGTFPVDVISMFVDLIPKEWKLGTSEYPEKWIFWIAGDRIVIKASPLGTDHNMFPVVIAAPDYNGHTPLGTSRMELVYGLQHYYNWIISSHVANQRKAINDMFVVDPSIINMKDMMNPGPGKLIRLNKPVWGKGVKDGIMQFPVADVTRQNMPDLDIVGNLIYRITGADSSSIQGVTRQSGERVTATEVQGTRTSAVGRAQHAFKIARIQYMNDLSDMLASQTQQYMTQDTIVELNGRYEAILKKEFGTDQEPDPTHALVTPEMIDCDYDIISYDSFMPGGEDPQALAQLFQPLLSQPEVVSSILQKINMSRVFQHILRTNNVNSYDSFEYSSQEQAQIAQEQAMNMQQQEQMMLKQQQLEQQHALALESIKAGAKITVSDNERVIREQEKGNLVPA